MIANALEVRASDSDDDEVRDALVRATPAGSFFHLSAWRRAVEGVMKHRGRDLCAWRGEDLVGVLPLVECKGLRGGRSLLSVPYAVYGGPVATDVEARSALVKHAEALAVEEGMGRLELRCREDLGLDWPSTDLHATFEKALPTQVDQVLAGMPKKARAEARKARTRHGLVLEEGPWYLPDLARLFHQNKRSLGSPGLPIAFFEALMAENPGQVFVHLVRRGSQPLAACMSFTFADTFCAYYSGTAEGADREWSASNFMYMALQEWCVERGIRRFDFGRSRKDSGAFSFKERQGFEAVDLHYRFRLVKERGLPSLNPSNPKTKVLRDTWRRLPLWMTERLSTRASRYLP
jgi:FemAB-related protein (PEP-CTERM system-associated)